MEEGSFNQGCQRTPGPCEDLLSEKRTQVFSNSTQRVFRLTKCVLSDWGGE